MFVLAGQVELLSLVLPEVISARPRILGGGEAVICTVLRLPQLTDDLARLEVNLRLVWLRLHQTDVVALRADRIIQQLAVVVRIAAGVPRGHCLPLYRNRRRVLVRDDLRVLVHCGAILKQLLVVVHAERAVLPVDGLVVCAWWLIVDVGRRRDQAGAGKCRRKPCLRGYETRIRHFSGLRN